MQTAREKIRELRALHDDGLLSQQEFDRRKNAILDAEYAPPGGAGAPIHVRQGTELGLMSTQEIGPQNRRYRLERLIGMGGMGQVWQALDLATHAELGHSEMVALKILPPQLTQSATHAKLLIEEATQARKLAHENIVRVYEWAQDPATSSYFIIMEYLEGEDLDAYLAREGKLPLDAVLQLLASLGDALQYAWDKHKLVHRDIKPGNVFLTRHGEIKLLDFGIASRVRSAGSSLGLQTPNAGTTGYRAPEAGTYQRQPSPRLDVYAVAVMIYQMLEGRMPFDDMRPADFHPSSPTGLNAQQWKVLQSGFAYAQERRPASVAALLDALRLASGPSEDELAARAETRRLQEQQRKAEQAAQAERDRIAAEQARAAAEQRQAEAAAQAARRHAEAQAAAAEKQRQEKLRKEQEARQRAEAEAAARLRKQQQREVLREQLAARREADAQKARAEREEQQRKAQQIKAEAAYRSEQERHRKEMAERAAAELRKQMPTPGSPVADANGVLRDRFLDGAARGPELVLIPTGRFQMGSNDHEHAIAMKSGAQKNWLARETPAHWVGIEHSFAMGRYPVTVGEWKRFVKATGWESQSDTDWRLPGFAQTDEHPVVGVSWNDAQLYLKWLSEQTGQSYRLPSEAEWEYACRAGTKTAFSFGDEISTELANYDGHYTYNGSPKGAFLQGTSKVGQYPPNPWGLFDMHGNVWEWVQDVVHENYDGAPLDGSAWEEGGDPARRVLRGGSWLYSPRYLRSALRNGFSAVLANDIVGFRVARKLG